MLIILRFQAVESCSLAVVLILLPAPLAQRALTTANGTQTTASIVAVQEFQELAFQKMIITIPGFLVIPQAFLIL